MTTLNLNNIIDVTVTVSPAAAARGSFNEMLILGITGLTISETITTTERVRKYASLVEMLADGFAITDAEYLAASVYFAQSPAPTTVWIGVRDDTSSPEESISEALQACRVKEASWYIAYSVEAVASDIEEMALAVQSMTPSTVLVYNSSDATILESEPAVDDLPTVLKDNSYSRTLGVYSTDDHIAAGIMGVACGLNTGLANSSFTLLGKSIIGNVTEDVTSSERGIVEAKNCNLYVNYANYYNIFEQGVMANGYFFDQVLQRDMLVNDIQLSCMDLIYQNKKVPQTEAGMAMIYNALMAACESAVTRGHLGAGTYTGASFMNLNYGDSMPNGYVIQSEKLSDQTIADRALRKSVSFYITVKEAGAVHSMNIEVIVNV
jgi:hypothetical protein